MVMLPKRHYVIALKRSTFQRRGRGFSEYGTLIRCVRPDQSAVTVRVHYLTEGMKPCLLRSGSAEHTRAREWCRPLSRILATSMVTTGLSSAFVTRIFFGVNPRPFLCEKHCIFHRLQFTPRLRVEWYRWCCSREHCGQYGRLHPQEGNKSRRVHQCVWLCLPEQASSAPIAAD